MRKGISKEVAFQGKLNGSVGKESTCNPGDAGDAGDLGSIPGLGRSPREGNGNLLQDYCLKNPTDRGDWWAYGPQGHKESETTEVTEHAHMEMSQI